MVQNVIILGGGSAGFLAALALKVKLPKMPVVVIRSKEIGIIGVGEGSTLGLTHFLHEYIAVSPKKFFGLARPTWKLGLRFLWGPRPYFNYTFSNLQLDGRLAGLRKNRAFYCEREMSYEHPMSAMMTHDRVFERLPNGQPAIDSDVAYHFENDRFVAFLEQYAVALGVTIVDDKVIDAAQNQSGIAALRLASGRTESADLYVDASGFASRLLGQALQEPFISFDSSLFCDRAVVGGWPRAGEPIKPYTTCETMQSGWCWQIEHEERINRGYVYCSAFTSDEAVERELRDKNPKVGPTRIVKFVSGRYRNLWVKNVVAIGNAGGFVEPLEATALGAIAHQSQMLADVLYENDGEVTPSQRKYYNLAQQRNWESIRAFLAVHYRFNRRIDSAFWRHCHEKTELAGAEGVVECFRENGPTFYFAPALLDGADQFGMAGYLALLVGQRVEQQRPYQPTEAEMRIWDAARQKQREMALRAASVAESLAAIRSPKWEWRKS